MYDEQFMQTLTGKGATGVYGGDADKADLRFLYNRILNAIKQVSVFEKNAEFPVQLKEVDEQFVKARTIAVLDKEAKKIAPYEREEILKTLCKHTADINASISSDIKDLTKKSSMVIPIYSIAELRKKGLV